jgi:ribokinase
MKPEVVGLGAMNLDRLLRVEKIVREGEVPAQGIFPVAGGSAANTVYALARLGVATGFIGAVGDDEEGQRLIADLEGQGVDTGHIATKPGVPTGTIFGLVDKKGHRALYALPGANACIAPEDIDLDYINQASFLHLSSFVGDEQLRLERILLERLAPRVKVSFAPGQLFASRGLGALAPLIRRSYILFLNQMEIDELAGGDYRAAAQRLGQNMGCPMVVVTLGGKGGKVCYIAEGRNEHLLELAVQPEVIVDSTGAGDAFAAGVLFGLLKGEKIITAARLGELMAACCLAEMGARAGLPTREELLRSYRKLFT